MAITIDWPTGVISVPQADLTFISGTLYELDTDWFRLQLRALEASEEGIAWDTTHTHNTEVTVAGTTFARQIEIINGYSVQFTPNSQWTVRLVGSNNNIFDVENGILVQNQVQVIPSNSAGLIVTVTGSGLSTTQDDRLKDLWDIIRGKNVINRATGNLEVYDSGGSLLYTAPIYEDAAGLTAVGPSSTKIDRRNRLT